MTNLDITFTLTPEGIDARAAYLGKIATIVRELTPGVVDAWYVRPYRFATYERGARWKSLDAAKAYATTLAHEMLHTQEIGAPPRPDHERRPTPEQAAAHALATERIERERNAIIEQGPPLDKPDQLRSKGEPLPSHHRPMDRSLAERPASRLSGPDGEAIPPGLTFTSEDITRPPSHREP